MSNQDESKRENKAKKVETDVYINGEHYIQVTITDYYGNVVYSSLYKH